MIEPYSPNLIWLIVISFIIAFILAFGIGANDIANSFGTSVGAKVLTIAQACTLATIFEIAGAILIGYKVSDTMRKGILDVNLYDGAELELMLGCVSALAASAIWLLVATFLKMPISGTHSIVGATIGFSLAARGFKGLKWTPLFTIMVSWFLSPVLSGLMSVVIYKLIDVIILSKPRPIKPALISLPFFYGFTAIVNIFSIVHNGPKLLYMDNIPVWMAAAISLSIGALVMIGVQLILVPWQKKRIKKTLEQEIPQVNFSIGESSENSPNVSPSKHDNRLSQISEDRQGAGVEESAEMLPLTKKAKKSYIYKSNAPTDHGNDYEFKTTEGGGIISVHPNKDKLRIVDSTATLNPLITPNTSTPAMRLNTQNGATTLDIPQSDQERIKEREKLVAAKLFSFLQILTATFGSFAHGGNDVSNAIGPAIAIWLIYSEGTVRQESETPIFLLLFGGAGISAGLWILGRRVIKTVGEDLTKITPENGFAIELGAAFTVLLASKIGLPISTTHCKVGSVVFVGFAATSKNAVDWKLFRNIISAWLITVPVACLLAAGCMLALKYTVL